MYDAIVLAGGAARRLDGADKPGVDLDGRPLIERVLRAVSDARRVIVAGPVRETRVPVVWCREEPPGSGPVAAIAAALPHVGEPIVVLLAADLPWIAPAVPMLRAAITGTDAAVLADADGRRNYLAAAWHTAGLRTALARVGDPAGAAMKHLYAGARVTEIADPAGWGQDCDTWDDIDTARRRAGGSSA